MRRDDGMVGMMGDECGGVVTMRCSVCRRVGGQPSSRRLGTAMWTPWRCCWTAAPTWRPRPWSAPWVALRSCYPGCGDRGVGGVGSASGRAWLAAPGLEGGGSRAGGGVSGACVVWLRCNGGEVGVVGILGDEFVGVVTMRCSVPQNGATALIAAARSGHVDAMAMLLDRGADLEAKERVSPMGRTPQLQPSLRRLRHRWGRKCFRACVPRRSWLRGREQPRWWRRVGGVCRVVAVQWWRGGRGGHLRR